MMNVSRLVRQMFLVSPFFSCPDGSTSRPVSIGLSQGVAKPSPPSLQMSFSIRACFVLCSVPEVFVPSPVFLKFVTHTLVNKCMDPSQCGLVY